jgi:actin-related protein 6
MDGLPSYNSFTRIIPNTIVRSKGDKKTYFGHEIAQCKDYSTLHFRLPFEKVIIHYSWLSIALFPSAHTQGYLVDWDAQKAVWDGIFSDQVLAVSLRGSDDDVVLTAGKIDTTQSSLLITEPYFNLPNIQDVYDQMIFEEYEFAAYYRSTRRFY